MAGRYDNMDSTDGDDGEGEGENVEGECNYSQNGKLV
jgi:hypothetical protein